MLSQSRWPLEGLPALASQTRTTLKGAVSAVSSAVFAGDDVRLEGSLELENADGTFTELLKFNATKVTHFPVELVAVEPAAPLPVNQWTNVPVTFRNTTNRQTPETKIKASTKPLNVEINNPDGFVIPALEPGASQTVTLSMKPSVWAGGAPVVFAAESLNAAGAVVLEQRLKKDLQVARSARLTLLGSNGQPSDGTPLQVTAGTTVTFKLRFDFQSSTRRGPFVLRYANASDPGIAPSNSTTRVDLGYWNPGTTMSPTTFTFKVPATLKGKPAWIAIALDEGGSAVHMLQVWLDVR